LWGAKINILALNSQTLMSKMSSFRSIGSRAENPITENSAIPLVFKKSIITFAAL